MKVALLCPEFIPPWGGVGVYSFELAKALSKYDNLELHVITPKRGKETQLNYLKELGPNVQIHFVSNANDTFFYNAFFQLAILTKFSQLNNKHKFDICHSTSLVQMPDIFLKFRKWDIPFVTTVHTTIDSQSRLKGKEIIKSKRFATVEILSRIVYPYIRSMEGYYLRKTENFICVSSWIKLLSKIKTARVIHNGVDEKRFSPKERSNPVPVVLYTGRLLALKGVDVMLQGLKPLLLAKEIKLIICGEGDRCQYEGILIGVKKESYHFAGAVDYQAIQKWYQKSDIFVLPSLTESFPLSVLEAMSCGCAVVSTRVGGVPEMIVDGKEGLLIEPNDSVALRVAVGKLARDKELRNRLGITARKRIENEFSSQKMAERTYQYYKELT